MPFLENSSLGFVSIGVYTFQAHHWNIPTTDGRWECDDFVGYIGVGDNPNTTTHQIWVR